MRPVGQSVAVSCAKSERHAKARSSGSGSDPAGSCAPLISHMHAAQRLQADKGPGRTAARQSWGGRKAVGGTSARCHNALGAGTKANLSAGETAARRRLKAPSRARHRRNAANVARSVPEQFWQLITPGLNLVAAAEGDLPASVICIEV